jgi:hypothetical protein
MGHEPPLPAKRATPTYLYSEPPGPLLRQAIRERLFRLSARLVGLALVLFGVIVEHGASVTVLVLGAAMLGVPSLVQYRERTVARAVAAGGDLEWGSPAIRAEVQRLEDDYAADRITLEEFEERVGRVLHGEPAVPPPPPEKQPLPDRPGKGVILGVRDRAAFTAALWAPALRRMPTPIPPSVPSHSVPSSAYSPSWLEHQLAQLQERQRLHDKIILPGHHDFPSALRHDPPPEKK